MFRKSIPEEPGLEIIFETAKPVLFSLLHDGSFEKIWKAWKFRHFEVRADGTLVYRKSKKGNIKDKLDISQSTFVRVVLDEAAVSANSESELEYGVSASCTIDGVQSHFRCVLPESELNKLFLKLQKHLPSVKIDVPVTNLERTDSINNAESSYGGSNSKTRSILGLPKRIVLGKSSMRTAITHAMDKYQHLTTQQGIRKRRGAFKFLPVFFANDLVNGSWWFVLGSVLIVMTAAVTLANSFNHAIGDDDSTLTRFHYRGSWVLMIISGVFFTLGSLAFVRAVHESPPMKPLFSWYHLGTDELLGSWLFLIAVIPFFPYVMIYMSEAHNKLLYIGLLIAAFILICGCFLFVLSCYPSEENRPQRQYILPILKLLLCCCCSSNWIMRNLANDWLAGTWIVLWGTLVTCVATLVLTLAAGASQQWLQVFIYGTTFIENAIFLIGSAYFVAGSYPDSLTDSLLDSAISDTGSTPSSYTHGVNPLIGMNSVRRTSRTGGGKSGGYMPTNSFDVEGARGGGVGNGNGLIGDNDDDMYFLVAEE